MTIKWQGWETTDELERSIREALSIYDFDALPLQCTLQNQETPDADNRADAFLALCCKKLEA